MRDQIAGFDAGSRGRQEIGNDSVRYLLVERWADGPLIGYAGMNPSKAGAARTDNTFTTFNGFARRWGFAGTVWVNLIPFRTASQKEAAARLRAALGGPDPNWRDRDLLADNHDHLWRASELTAVWLCGWGAGGQAFDDIAPGLIDNAVCGLEPTTDADATFLTFGLTLAGCPKHVLARGAHRIPPDAPVYRFEPLARQVGAAVSMPWTGA